MKNEDLRFSVFVESHNGLGEKQRSPIDEHCSRSRVISISESLGIELSYNSPYSMHKEKQYPIEKEYAPKIRNNHFIIIGEFKYEPLLCIKRL